MIKTWQQRCEEHPDHEGIVTEQMIRDRMQEEIDELRQALAESANSTTDFVESKAPAQPEQEPVAWLTDREEIYFDKEDAYRNSDGFIQPLYTAPQWVGLTDDEREHFRKLGFVGVLAVENALKEKNCGN